MLQAYEVSISCGNSELWSERLSVDVVSVCLKESTRAAWWLRPTMQLWHLGERISGCGELWPRGGQRGQYNRAIQTVFIYNPKPRHSLRPFYYTY
jgi:hypothetical protein